MADTDEASVVAAQEAETARQAAEKASKELRPIVRDLGYSDEIGSLDTFDKKFSEYQTLDTEILGLAVENTNLKAQRLAFGPAREAADAFQASLDRLAATSKDVDALAARAALAIRQMQVLEARHIAEPDDAAMTRMETEMTALATNAEKTLQTLAGKIAPGSKSTLAEAAAALDRFKSLNGELISLSRRNSNVKSLALSMGRKRTLTAECDDTLRVLQDALARHEFKATR